MSIEISLKFVSMGPKNASLLGAKPLSEPMMTYDDVYMS